MNALRRPSFSQLGVEREGGMLLDNVVKRVITALVDLLIISRARWNNEQVGWGREIITLDKIVVLPPSFLHCSFDS